MYAYTASGRAKQLERRECLHGVSHNVSHMGEEYTIEDRVQELLLFME